MSSVSEAHIRQAWLGLLDSERLTRYYSYLAVRFQQRYQWLTLVVAFGSVATAIASWVPAIPTWVAGLTSIGVAGAAIWSLLADYSRRSLHASTLEADCSEVVLQWKALWSELGSLNDQIAAERIRSLGRQEADITKHVSAQLPLVAKLNERCASEAYEAVQNEQRQQSRP